LTLQKPKKLAIIAGIVMLVVVVYVSSASSCGVKHVMIINDISSYEKSLDPEFCEGLVQKILDYNEQCNDSIEIYDCG
jgi:hypothetical protein